MLYRRLLQRVLGPAFLLFAWAFVSSAKAEGVLFVSSAPRAPQLLTALNTELLPHGVTARRRFSPDARSSLERAAAAQRIARNLGADVALWFEHEGNAGLRLRAVASQGERIVEAPLPGEMTSLDARMIALIATDLVLDALERVALPRPEADTVQSVTVACDCMPPWKTDAKETRP